MTKPPLPPYVLTPPKFDWERKYVIISVSTFFGLIINPNFFNLQVTLTYFSF